MERNEKELRQLLVNTINVMDFEQLSEVAELFDIRSNCKHPLIDEVWSAIPGEPHLQQPDHIECLVCGKRI